MPLFSKPEAPIYGLAGFLQFTVKIEGEENGDDFLYRYASETHLKLEAEIRQQVSETLGSDFEVLYIRLDRGCDDPHRCRCGWDVLHGFFAVRELYKKREPARLAIKVCLSEIFRTGQSGSAGY